MRTVNSPSMIVIRKHEDPVAFDEWARFYERNGCFPSMTKTAKQMNVMAVFSPWPPTNPAEVTRFEEQWIAYQVNTARTTDQLSAERIKRKYALPDNPFYAPYRSQVDGAA